jgi:hypothetical protein
MVLDLINKCNEQYKEYLSSDKTAQQDIHFNQRYALVSLKAFQDNWNIDADDFKSMFVNSFANTLSNDLWEGRSFYPKKTMLVFIDRDPDLVRTMFKELFDENLDIDGRIDRFIYHCDEISRDIMRNNPQYQSHYHGDYRMISVYLTFRFPGQYTIYSYSEYKVFMDMIKAKPEAGPMEIGRFFKVMRTVNSIISKDEEFMAIYAARSLGSHSALKMPSTVPVYGLYLWCGRALEPII